MTKKATVVIVKVEREIYLYINAMIIMRMIKLISLPTLQSRLSFSAKHDINFDHLSLMTYHSKRYLRKPQSE